MTSARNSFEERVAEIQQWLDFIHRLDQRDICISDSVTKADAFPGLQRDDLLRILRASTYLLIYNLMESTVTNVLESIYDELKVQGASFDSCRESLRMVIINNLKAINSTDIVSGIQQIAIDVIHSTFRKEKALSGNVDAREIRDLASRYGFESPKVPSVRQLASQRNFFGETGSLGSVAGDGARLLEVKNRRNDLAHGRTTFGDVGKATTAGDVRIIALEVIAYLDALLQNVDGYLSNQAYFGP